MLGMFYNTRRLHPQARRAFHKALDLGVDDPELRFHLGRSYLPEQRYGEALAELEESLRQYKALHPEVDLSDHWTSDDQAYAQLDDREKAQRLTNDLFVILVRHAGVE